MTFDAATWDALGCFFREKKDILLALFPRMDGMAGGFEKKTKVGLFYCLKKRSCAGVREGRASVQKEIKDERKKER